jgi:hypothetical protein
MKTSFAFACLVASCFGQQTIDKAFFGVWKLDVAKSKFPGTGPKGGQLFVNQNGYIAVWQDAEPPTPPATSIAIVGGQCYVIGHLGTSCAAIADNPRRSTIDIKMGDATVIKIETELQGDTMTVKQTSFASPNPVITMVYTKAAQPPAPAKK